MLCCVLPLSPPLFTRRTDGKLGCPRLYGKADTTSHLCDGSTHSSGCLVNGYGCLLYCEGTQVQLWQHSITHTHTHFCPIKTILVYRQAFIYPTHKCVPDHPHTQDRQLTTPGIRHIFRHEISECFANSHLSLS